MIKFNQLHVVPDGTKLIIDAEIENSPYYESVLITKVSIDTQDTYSENGPSEDAIYTQSFNDKHVHLELDNLDLQKKLNGNLLIVYVQTNGLTDMQAPCQSDKKIGVAVNLRPFYKDFMIHIKELANTCDVPKNLINQLLRFKALLLSIRTCNYLKAIQYWNEFFKDGHVNLAPNCRCYG